MHRSHSSSRSAAAHEFLGSTVSVYTKEFPGISFRAWGLKGTVHLVVEEEKGPQ